MRSRGTVDHRGHRDPEGVPATDRRPGQVTTITSRDGGATWTQRQISAAANNGQRNPPDGCTIRTDSLGNAYVFGIGTVPSAGKQSFELMSVSRNGGGTWSTQTPVVGPVHQPGIVDPGPGPPHDRRSRRSPQRPSPGT